MATDKTISPLRVFLWVIPRTNSTVFTKCMSFVDNTEVWMEPYMASNLNETIFSPTWRKGDPAIDKMRNEAKNAEEQSHYKDIKQRELEKVERYPNVWTQQTFSYPWAKKQLEINPKGKQFVFIKDQSCAIYDYMDYLPDVPTRHAFLIRHPMETYPSLKNVMINETFIDFGKVSWDESDLTDVVPYLPVKGFFEIHRNMWKKLKENGGPDPIIIDGHDLASKPEVILPKFFAELGIPYKESYLKWEGDPEKVYSTWKGSSSFVFFASTNAATSRAVESTGFTAPSAPRGTKKPQWKLTDTLKECVEYSLPFYEEMYNHRLA